MAATPRSYSFDYSHPCMQNGGLMGATRLLTGLDMYRGSGRVVVGDNGCRQVLEEPGYRPFVVTTFRPERRAVTVCTGSEEDACALRNYFDRVIEKAAGRYPQ